MALLPIVIIHSEYALSGTNSNSLKEDRDWEGEIDWEVDELEEGKDQSWLFRDYMQVCNMPKIEKPQTP